MERNGSSVRWKISSSVSSLCTGNAADAVAYVVDGRTWYWWQWKWSDRVRGQWTSALRRSGTVPAVRGQLRTRWRPQRAVCAHTADDHSRWSASALTHFLFTLPPVKSRTLRAVVLDSHGYGFLTVLPPSHRAECRDRKRVSCRVRDFRNRPMPFGWSYFFSCFSMFCSITRLRTR